LLARNINLLQGKNKSIDDVGGNLTADKALTYRKRYWNVFNP